MTITKFETHKRKEILPQNSFTKELKKKDVFMMLTELKRHAKRVFQR